MMDAGWKQRQTPAEKPGTSAAWGSANERAASAPTSPGTTLQRVAPRSNSPCPIPMTDDSSLKILLVDDHFIVRSGLVASLELETDLQVVAEAERGEEVLALFGEYQPDLVLMDLQLPGQNGIETTAALCREFPDANVLMFSTFARDDEVDAALEAGALGYLQKSAERSELIRAIRSVAGGAVYLSSDLADRVRHLRSGPNITLRE